jgi:hypothetical protein
MTDTDKSRFVATALGLPDCKGKTDQMGRAILPYDFTSPAGADLLLRTLLGNNNGVYFQRRDVWSAIVGTPELRSGSGLGDSWPEALLDAAYRLLKTDDRKTMEGM